MSYSTERAKRSYNDVLDPAKRMRFTSQLIAASGLMTSEKKIACVGNYMPGTVTKDAITFKAYVAHVEEQLQKERIVLKLRKKCAPGSKRLRRAIHKPLSKIRRRRLRQNSKQASCDNRVTIPIVPVFQI